MCSKTYCFRFVLQNKGKTGEVHLLYIHAREKDCGRKQGVLKMEGKRYKGGFHRKKGEKGKGEEVGMGA